jgi:putative transposase
MTHVPLQTGWHHAPYHVFVPDAVYMVTAGTLHKEHLYKDGRRLEILQSVLQDVLNRRGWELRAWALFSNHYHFIARSPQGDSHIRRLIQHLHSEASKALNCLDRTPGRKVWYQYWDRCLTFEKSYYPRLNYVIHNAVHHGLVRVAENYPFCSAGLFERDCPPSFRKKVASFRYDRLNEPDGFDPVWERGGGG